MFFRPLTFLQVTNNYYKKSYVLYPEAPKPSKQEFNLVPLEEFQYFMPLECYVVGEKRENTISLRYRRFDT